MLTQNQILDAVEHAYRAEGAPGVSMRHIARRLSVSPTALYRHFRNKEEIIQALLGRARDSLFRFESVGLAASSAAARMQGVAAGYLAFGLAEPHLYDALFLDTQLSKRTPFFGGEAGGEGETPPALQLLIDRVRECMGEGLIANEEPRAAALTLWAAGHGVVAFFLTGRLSESETIAAYTHAHAAAWRGLGAKKSLFTGVNMMDMVDSLISADETAFGWRSKVQ